MLTLFKQGSSTFKVSHSQTSQMQFCRLVHGSLTQRYLLEHVQIAEANLSASTETAVPYYRIRLAADSHLGQSRKLYSRSLAQPLLVRKRLEKKTHDELSLIVNDSSLGQSSIHRQPRFRGSEKHSSFTRIFSRVSQWWMMMFVTLRLEQLLSTSDFSRLLCITNSSLKQISPWRTVLIAQSKKTEQISFRING